MTGAPVDVIALYERHGGLLRGHFELSSGLHSPEYWQSALVLSQPEVAAQLGAVLGDRLRALNPNIIVGPAMGGLIIAHEVARALGCPMLFTERKEGAMTLRRGFQVGPDARIAVVEDVITTGGSAREVIALLRGFGATVAGVACVVDRSNGTAEFDVPFTSLIQVPAIAYDPAKCPECQAGTSAVKPGSRPGASG